MVVDGEGRVVRGLGRPGRGAWLCAESPGCLDQALRRRSFERAFRRPMVEGATDGLAERLAQVGAAEAG